MRSFAVIGLAVLAAVVYGVAHDLVTAHVCVEYFTLGHPPVFPSVDPVWLALGWGVLATWWVGFLLGIPLAIACRHGSRPERSARSLVAPLGVLIAVSAACAVVAGVAGYLLAHEGLVFLVEPQASRVPTEKHAAYLAAMWAHGASYAAGIVGGIALCVRVWKARH